MVVGWTPATRLAAATALRFLGSLPLGAQAEARSVHETVRNSTCRYPLDTTLTPREMHPSVAMHVAHDR